MKRFAIISLVLLSGLSVTHNAVAMAPTLDLEKKIAYEQGYFGALYAQCGSNHEREVIGGTLANWKNETFRGYNGNQSDRTAVLTAFDAAARDVANNGNSCKNWVRQAAQVWHNIIQLSQYGTPYTPL